MEFKIQTLLFQFRRYESVRKTAGELLGGAIEQVDGCNVKKLCLSNQAVSVTTFNLVKNLLQTHEFISITPTLIVRLGLLRSIEGAMAMMMLWSGLL
jgi:hypothetical protein